MSGRRAGSGTPAGARRFGLVVGGLFCGVFGVLLPLVAGLSWPVWPHVVGGSLILVAWLRPAVLVPVERAWMRMGAFLGPINRRILLAIVYGVVVLPIGLVMRAFGRDPLRRRRDPEASSYRVPSEKRPSDHVEHPF